MKQQTVVFFGRSGAGKGTQANLLVDYLKKHDPKNKVIYVETGARFREFMEKSGTHTAKHVKEILGRGELMPPFFPVWMWSGMLIEQSTGKEHMIFDGVSRRLEEAPVLDSALKFYGKGRPKILFLELHHDAAKDRLLKRGRHDDHHEKIAERMRWFETDVLPAVSYFKNNPGCDFVEIDGDQTIENVHKSVLKALGI